MGILEVVLFPCQVNDTFCNMNTLKMYDKINRAAEYLKAAFPETPTWCIVLGSGLGGFSEQLERQAPEISYQNIPGFPRPSVKGHSGKLFFGYIQNIPVVVMSGRFHLYEGHDPQDVVLPYRALISLGVSHFFLTNAAGGIRPDLKPGDLMLIRDHLNLLGANPLSGPNLDQFGTRFPAMTAAYDPSLRDCIKREAEKLAVNLAEGVYAALPGPSYETPAEINMLQILGADAVGMSTVPEVLVIRHADRKVCAVSVVTNATASPDPPTHQEVVDVANACKNRFFPLIRAFITESGKA